MSIPGNFQAPGLHFVESGGPPRVVPASTNVGGMVGQALRGPTNKSKLIGSWSEYQKFYGGFPALPAAHVMGSLSAFLHFLNGGGPLFFVRVVGDGGVVANALDLKNNKHTPGVGDDALDVYAQNVGAWANQISVSTQQWETTNLLAEVAPGGAGAPDAVIAVSSIEGVQVGDVVNIIDSTDAYDGFAVVGNIIANSSRYPDRNLVSGSTYLLLADDASINGGTIGASGKIRSASRHLASTRLTEQFVTTTTTLKLDSVSGIKIGSLLTAVLVALCNDDTTRDVRLEGSATVSAVSGKTVTLAATLKDHAPAPADAATIAKDVKAFAKTTFTNNANTEGFTLTAVKDGGSGNDVSYEITIGAAANKVSVVGNHIKIDILNTLAKDVFTLINANAEAAKLVTAAQIVDGAAGDATVDAAVATRFLTGGAFARVVSQEFDLTVKEAGDQVERHEGLSVSATSANDVNQRLGGTATVPSDDNQSTRVTVLRDADVIGSVLEDMPKVVVDQLLTGGIDDAAPSDVAAVGVSTQGSETGIFVLEGNEALDFLEMPGFNSPFTVQSGVDFATRNQIMFISETPQSDSSFDAVTGFVQGELGVDDTHLDMYTPWVKIDDPRDRTKTVEMPPSAWVGAEYGFVSDNLGVHVPVANRRALRGPKELVIKFTKAQRDALDKMGVNPLRHVRGSGFRLYGTQTRSSTTDPRQYVPVRRTVNFIERSLEQSFGSLVMLNADKSLMRDIEYALDTFLRAIWEQGALFPDDDASRAWLVKVDDETTTAADLDNGVINVEVHLSHATPAKHIVFGLNISSGGITITERRA